MIDASLIKETIRGFGADLCGIAPAESFGDVPAGFHPCDIYEKCRSVVVFAKRRPATTLRAISCIPNTLAGSVMKREVDNLAVAIALKMDEIGVGCVPIPSNDPYEHWEPELSYGRAILSLKHAARLAGLGVLGKSTLLINKDFGNMVQLGAVLVDAELEGDPPATFEGCLPECSLCIESCPVAAIDGETVNQQLCRPQSLVMTEKGEMLQKCYTCRSVCPHALGVKE
jgi:epoxyqueuosine reductase QueG